jgi:putative tryptophan/tyrosine transport system substrate-binding protein
MRRREFIAGLGGVAAWPVAARAQQPRMPVIGFLNGQSSDAGASLLAAFREGLNEQGYVDGHNVTIQLRWADGQYDRLPALAKDLVNRGVAAIAAGSPPAAQAAKAATSAIPIVFTSGVDVAKLGLVSSFSRPGGNITGISFLVSELTTKQLGLLHDLLPAARVIALLLNPNFYDVAGQFKDTQNAARAIGLRLEILAADTEHNIDAAFDRFAELQVGALMVCSDAFMFGYRDKIVALATSHAVPTIYNLREFVPIGGLMSYDTSITDAYRQVGVYVGRILKGEKPANLPVVQPTKFEFVINLKTAKALGLTVPETLLAIADEVIQ